ncbi:MAG: methyltransferase domain-containing protein [Cyanobacteria bacterium SID2]|nr:methyltransferase domain-containing protein [Cyanobacteria bacterium SID2]MBP0002316.1 methyltransferase domain-containing protein [Cyanobacteria bacterium SBC]
MVVKLHIGGKKAHPDWKIFDIEPRPEVDFVGNAADLSQFEDNSIDAIYASHVLEHFYHSLNNELIDTLTEWHRVLKPGGKLLISVPDLQTVCWLYLNPNLLPFERLHLMRVMFGGQTNEFDVHKVGFDFDILALYLEEVGFFEYERVMEFNLFDDCSSLRLLDTLISLNVIATKTDEGEENLQLENDENCENSEEKKNIEADRSIEESEETEFNRSEEE